MTGPPPPAPIAPTAGARWTVGVGLGRRPGPQPRLLPGLGPTAVLPAEQSLRLLPAPLLRELPRGGPADGIWGDSLEKCVSDATCPGRLVAGRCDCRRREGRLAWVAVRGVAGGGGDRCLCWGFLAATCAGRTARPCFWDIGDPAVLCTELRTEGRPPWIIRGASRGLSAFQPVSPHQRSVVGPVVMPCCLPASSPEGSLTLLPNPGLGCQGDSDGGQHTVGVRPSRAAS